MSADAIARLREALSPKYKFRVQYVHGLVAVNVSEDDLCALLDAHTEALDALVGALHVLRESDAADVWEEETDAVKAVLAKAGRR